MFLSFKPRELVMPRYYVITWRAPGGRPYFFRGDGRYEIFLPYISETHVPRGWVENDAYARLFEAFPVFTEKSLAKNFRADRLNIYPYESEVQPTHSIRPVKRPQDPFKFRR